MPKKYDRFIHAAMLILMTLGTLMIVSTSVGKVYSSDTIVIKTLVKQLGFSIFAYLIMIQFANHFTVSKASKVIKPLGYLLVLAMFMCLAFPAVGGGRCWIRFSIPFIGEMTIQPSEFAKTFMIVIMACVIEKVKKKRMDFWEIIKIPFIFYLVLLLAIVLQNDLGSLIVLSLVCAVCLLLPTHPSLKKIQKYLLIALLVGSIIVVILASNPGIAFLEALDILPSYMLGRFKTAADPWFDPTGDGYQLIQSLYAFASGGLNGLGLGGSIQKLEYLPEAETDYILSITVEELGILGFGLILIGYFVIIWRLILHALDSEKEGHKIIYIGTALYLFIHFTFNVGGVCGLIPLTGIPLLFISSGSSSLWSICIAIGICQAVAAEEKRTKLKEETTEKQV